MKDLKTSRHWRSPPTILTNSHTLLLSWFSDSFEWSRRFGLTLFCAIEWPLIINQEDNFIVRFGRVVKRQKNFPSILRFTSLSCNESHRETIDRRWGRRIKAPSSSLVLWLTEAKNTLRTALNSTQSNCHFNVIFGYFFTRFSRLMALLLLCIIFNSFLCCLLLLLLFYVRKEKRVFGLVECLYSTYENGHDTTH